MRYCCENCFSDMYLKNYIRENGEKGTCEYCNSQGAYIITTEQIGEYIRECIKKAYEDVGGGTGANYDPEEKEYGDRKGEEPILLSVRDIIEDAFDERVQNTSIITDIFEDFGLGYKGMDWLGNVDEPHLVLQKDLYGSEATRMHHFWELFKYTTKFYNRFFDMGNDDNRKAYLDELMPYLYEYERLIPKGEVLYRARKAANGLMDITKIDAYKELSPAPPLLAKTNRMSPAGISYLYIASDIETAYEECRLKDHDALVAEYVTKEELSIIDFSQEAFIWSGSIFDPNYDHDLRWINTFLKDFVEEITSPVDKEEEENKDFSFEYAATEVIAEYIRSREFDGICFNSSIGKGKSYVFFCGPDKKYYDIKTYGYIDPFLEEYCPEITNFREWFDIQKLELIHISEDGKTYKIEDSIEYNTES